MGFKLSLDKDAGVRKKNSRQKGCGGVHTFVLHRTLDEFSLM